MRKSTSGFTIVELLIVIVVIAILAAITVVAYNAVQARAKDSKRDTIVHTIQTALGLYYADNSSYPNACGSFNGCSISQLNTSLVPTYLNSIPNEPTPVSMQYVVNTTFTGYGIYVGYESKPPCKYFGGASSVTTNNGWWGYAMPAC